MKFFYTLMCCFLAISSYAKDINVVIYSDYTVEGYVLYATNKEDFPVVIEFNFTLKNLDVVRESSGPIIVPPRVADFKLLKLIPINKLGDYSYDFTHTVKNATELLIAEDDNAFSIRKNIIPGSRKNDFTDSKSVAVLQVNQQTGAAFTRLGERSSKRLTRENTTPSEATITTETDKQQNKILAEITEQAKIKEEERLAEIARQAKIEEEERLAEVARQAKIEEDKRLAEIAKQAKIVEEERLAEVTRQAKIEEDKRLAEVARQAKLAEEERLAEVAKQAKLKEEKRLAAIAEQERIAQEERLLAIEKQAKLDAEKRIEEVVRQAKLEEEKRIAAVVEKARKEGEEKLAAVTNTTPKSKIVTSSAGNTTKDKVAPKTSEVNKVSAPAPKKIPTLEVTGKYEIAYKYNIPLSKGTGFTIAQGYQGATSHQNKFAVDFAVANGSEVQAARDGVVVYVEESQTTGCGNENCNEYDNSIVVKHADGSYAKYAHLQENGAIVQVGGTVSQGQLIGYSGNTGWTAEPSLHFEVFVQKENNEQKTIKTNFKMGDGSDYGLLFEQQYYTKEY